MELFFHFLLKLTVIFWGGGLVSLLAFWVAKEAKEVSALFIKAMIKKMQYEKLVLVSSQRINFQSGLFEILLPGTNKSIKVFSSAKRIKVI